MLSLYIPLNANNIHVHEKFVQFDFEYKDKLIITFQYVVNKAEGGGKLACYGNSLLSYKNLSLAFWATPYMPHTCHSRPTQETLTNR